MHRLTARLLLLFALTGSFVPVAMQALAAPVHACCRRKAAHECHGSAELEGRVISSMSCCQQNSSRGITTSKSATHSSRTSLHFVDRAYGHSFHLNVLEPPSRSGTLKSPRGPPQVSIA